LNISAKHRQNRSLVYNSEESQYRFKAGVFRDTVYGLHYTCTRVYVRWNADEVFNHVLILVIGY